MSPIADEVTRVFEHIAHPTYIDQVIDALNALHDIFYYEHEVVVLNALNEENTDLIISNVQEAIVVALEAVCSMHRVKVDTDNAALEQLTQIVRALNLMVFWEDSDSIVDICSSDASTEDKLACIIGLVGQLREHEAQEVIMEVDEALIRGLLTHHDPKSMQNDDEAVVLDQGQIERLRSWRDHMKAHRTIAYRMMQAGYKPGFLFEEYTKRVAHHLNDLTNEQVALEMLSLTLLGRDTWQNQLQAWRDNANLTNLDAADIAQVDTAVLRLLGTYDNLTKGNK